MSHPSIKEEALIAEQRSRANSEKNLVAWTSVGAAVLLTTMKLVVGLSTRSLGILSEAAHSGLDLVAAAITLYAVRASARPADSGHPYGHGKIENLSALVETLLLLVTCVWIIREGIERMFFKNVEVDATVWAFLTVVVSMIVDFSRSRALARAARRHHSQALEADALHFSTDIWSSGVVLLGLVLVRISAAIHVHWLSHADVLAALGVAGIVIWVSVQLGRRTIADLVDAVSPALRDQVVQAVKVPGVQEVRLVRIRHAGPDLFADVTLTVPRSASLERAHDIATEAEGAVKSLYPGADVVVHVDPVASRTEGLLDGVRILAARHGLGAHGVRIYAVDGGALMDMHLEVDDSLTVSEAHQKAAEFEEALRTEYPFLDRLEFHLEPVGDESATYTASRGDEELVESTIREITKGLGVQIHPHRLAVRRIGEKLSISFHCLINPRAPITAAHSLTEEIEFRLRQRLPRLGRIVVHIEPMGADPSAPPPCEQGGAGAERERSWFELPRWPGAPWKRTTPLPPWPAPPNPTPPGKEPPRSP